MVAKTGQGPGDLRLTFGLFAVGDRLAVIESTTVKCFDSEGYHLATDSLPLPVADPLVDPWRVKRTLDGWIGHLSPGSRDKTVEVHFLGDDGFKKLLTSFPWPQFREDHEPRDNNPIKSHPSIKVSLDLKVGVIVVPNTNRVVYFDLVKRKTLELALRVPRIPVDETAFNRSFDRMRTRFRSKTGQKMNHDLPEYLPPIDQAAIGLNGEIVIQIGHFVQGTKTLAFDTSGNPVTPTLSTNDLGRIITCNDDQCLLSFMVDGEASLKWTPRAEVVDTLKANPPER